MFRWTVRDYRRGMGWVVFAAGAGLVLRFLPLWIWAVLAGGVTMWAGLTLTRWR